MKALQFDKASTERVDKAADLERQIRLEAFLSIQTRIGAFTVRSMTVRDYLSLEYIQNNLLLSRVPDLSDFVSLLWQLKPESEKRGIYRFTRYVKKNLTESDKNEIYQYLALQLNDVPTSSKKSETFVFGKDPNVSMVSIIDAMATEYGWNLDKILDMPIGATLQLLQRILKRHLGKDYSISNPITQKARATEMKGILNG